MRTILKSGVHRKRCVVPGFCIYTCDDLNIRMILCEFSKFSEVALNRVCKAEEVDFVFTDWNISAKEIKAWSDVGTKVIPATRE